MNPPTFPFKMPKGLVQSFVPYTQAIVPNDGTTLSLIFSIGTPERETSDVECNSRIVINCKDDALQNVSDYILEWIGECGTEQLVNQSSNNLNFVFTGSDGKSIQIDILKAQVSARNRFKLFAVIDSISILLAQGVIFSNI